MKSEKFNNKISYEMSIRNHERMLFATNLIDAIKVLRMHNKQDALSYVEEILKNEINRGKNEW